jgi:hypothetical protein
MPDEASKAGGAWPSPRSWDYASRILASAGCDATAALPLVSGCVGEAAALEISTWLTEMDLPDPEVLLKKPSSYMHPKRKDRAYAVLTSVVQHAIAKLDSKSWEAAWQILGMAARAGGSDVAAASARSLAREMRPGLALPADDLKEFVPVLRAAGML